MIPKVSGSFQVFVGIVAEVKDAPRTDKKTQKQIPGRRLVIHSMGCEPIEVREDLTQYGTDQANPFAAQMMGLQEGAEVLVVVRPRKMTVGDKTYNMSDTISILSDPKAFQYWGALLGVPAGK